MFCTSSIGNINFTLAYMGIDVLAQLSHDYNGGASFNRGCMSVSTPTPASAWKLIITVATN